MKNFNIKYNEYVQGFVVTHKETGAEANLQFCNLNREMVFGSDGGYKSDNWSDEIEELAYKELAGCEDVQEVQSMFRDIFGGHIQDEFDDFRAKEGAVYIVDLMEFAELAND